MKKNRAPTQNSKKRSDIHETWSPLWGYLFEMFGWNFPTSFYISVEQLDNLGQCDLLTSKRPCIDAIADINIIISLSYTL